MIVEKKIGRYIGGNANIIDGRYDELTGFQNGSFHRALFQVTVRNNTEQSI